MSNSQETLGRGPASSTSTITQKEIIDYWNKWRIQFEINHTHKITTPTEKTQDQAS